VQGRLALAAEKFAAHQEKVVERTLVPADLLRPALSQLTGADVFENLALQSCLPKDFVLLVAKLLQLRQFLFQILSVAGESSCCTADRTAAPRQ
jgi:hypothetical protein